MMNRDSTIVQVAIFLIIIAIIGVTILKQQNKNTTTYSIQPYITPILEGINDNKHRKYITGNISNISNDKITTGNKKYINTHIPPIENINSSYTKLIKQYFAAIATKDYLSACNIIAGGKCNNLNPLSINNFSKEFQKMSHGYEYVNIKDYGFTTPKGKHVICVKYSYKYKNDPKPGLVSEIMSFYIKKIGGTLKITDRVCEKKYKEGHGVRDCPTKADKTFCIKLIK